MNNYCPSPYCCSQDMILLASLSRRVLDGLVNTGVLRRILYTASMVRFSVDVELYASCSQELALRFALPLHSHMTISAPGHATGNYQQEQLQGAGWAGALLTLRQVSTDASSGVGSAYEGAWKWFTYSQIHNSIPLRLLLLFIFNSASVMGSPLSNCP